MKYTVLLLLPDYITDMPETYLAHVDEPDVITAQREAQYSAASACDAQAEDFLVLAVYAGHLDDVKQNEIPMTEQEVLQAWERVLRKEGWVQDSSYDTGVPIMADGPFINLRTGQRSAALTWAELFNDLVIGKTENKS